MQWPAMPGLPFISGSIHQPQTLFAGLLALSLARTLPALTRFYGEFANSGLKIASLRGYGQTGCGLYGLLPPPNLSRVAMGMSGFTFAMLLLTLCVPGLPAPCFAPLALGALLAYHFYFSQLYPESGTRASVTCLVPPTLILLSLCPVLNGVVEYSGIDAQLTARSGAFTAWLIKSLLFWAYCAAGISKFLASVKAGRVWWDGATLQAYIFEAMFLCKPRTHWSYGIPTPFTHEMQRFFFRRPTLLHLLAILTMIVELFAPVMLFVPAQLGSPVFCFVGLSLHFGIAYFQNIDFLSWWGPIYAFFLLDPAAMTGADPALFGPLGSAKAAFGIAPICSAVSLAFIAAQPIASITLQFVPKLEMLPFSRFGMFDVLRDLFDPASRKVIWLSEKAHATGTLNNYTFGPHYRYPNISPEEYALLPFRYLQMNYGGNEDGFIHANFKVEGELRACLEMIRTEGLRGQGVWATDPEAPDRLYAALRAAQNAFDALPPIDNAPKKSASDSSAIDAPLLDAAIDAPLLGA
jgi:hypothetical protein